MNELPFSHGLGELPPDDRDLCLGDLITLPALAELPAEFELTPLTIKDQLDTDFCTGYATCGASELQEGVELSPEYSFALSKSLSGNVDQYGQDVRTAMSVHVKYGALEEKDAPYGIFNKPADFLRRIGNWPATLYKKAVIHKKRGYAFVSGPYDAYDNVRATIWKFRNERRAVVFGTLWAWPLDQKIMLDVPESGNGHCLYIIGWNKQGLIVVNSGGINAGDKGTHIFGKKIINAFVPKYGAGTFLDYTKEELDNMLNMGIKLDTGFIMSLVKQILALFKPKPAVVVVPPVIPSLVTPSAPPAPTRAERLWTRALTKIGIDVTPKDEVSDEVACAQSVTAIYKEEFGEYIENPGISTTKLFQAMLDQPTKFRRILTPTKGALIICATGYSSIPTTPIDHGHVGIFADADVIMSNDSATGKWQKNYTLNTWAARWKIRGGYTIYIFEPI